jgi:hypothetical protein
VAMPSIPMTAVEATPAPSRPRTIDEARRRHAETRAGGTVAALVDRWTADSVGKKASTAIQRQRRRSRSPITFDGAGQPPAAPNDADARAERPHIVTQAPVRRPG